MFQEVKESGENFNFEKKEFKNPGAMNNQDFGCCENMCQTCPNICEAPRERVCHRYFCYEVPHIVPCNTRIINHHVYKHTYVPQYTCCEENECSNIYENCQNNFF